MSIPTCVRDVQMFLGMCNYYAKFVKNFASVAAPLYALLKKDATKLPFQWNEHAGKAFNHLKQALSHAPILSTPDFTKPFTLETDASDLGIGAVLVQNDRPIAYFSKSLTSAERNYSVHDRELLAIVAACRKWRHYLDGKVTKVLKDHKPL